MPGTGERSTDGRMLGLLLLTAVLPLLTLPWLFIGGLLPPSRVLSHASFHVLYLPITAAAAWFGLTLARTGRSRWLRVLAAVVVGTQAVGFVGHLGELWVVMRLGGFDAPESVFDHPTHVAFADVTPLAILVGAVVVVAAAIAWAVRRQRERRADLTAVG